MTDDKSGSTFNGIAIMWTIFGCVVAAITLLRQGDFLSHMLGLLASLLFFLSGWISWKRGKK